MSSLSPDQKASTRLTPEETQFISNARKKYLLDLPLFMNILKTPYMRVDTSDQIAKESCGVNAFLELLRAYLDAAHFAPGHADRPRNSLVFGLYRVDYDPRPDLCRKMFMVNGTISGRRGVNLIPWATIYYTCEQEQRICIFFPAPVDGCSFKNVLSWSRRADEHVLGFDAELRLSAM